VLGAIPAPYTGHVWLETAIKIGYASAAHGHTCHKEGCAAMRCMSHSLMCVGDCMQWCVGASRAFASLPKPRTPPVLEPEFCA
jgi:hypothetical protein